MPDEQNGDVTPTPPTNVENENPTYTPEGSPTEFLAPDDSLTPAPDAPAIQPVEQTTPFAPTPAPEFGPKKSKKPLFIGLIIAGVLLFLSGGTALAYNYWYQNPDKVVSDAIVNTITAKSVSATGTFEIETEDYKLNVVASGKTSPEAHSQVAVKISYSADDINVTVDGQGIYSAEGDIYVMLKDIKKLIASIEEQSDGQISFEVFGGVIEKVDGKWVKIGKEDLGDFSEEYEKTQKCFADISKQLEEDTSFRRAVEDETKELYQNNKFIIVDEKLGSRTINGQGSLGYLLSSDDEAADAFFTGLADTQIGKKLKECDQSVTFEDIVGQTAKEDEGTETRVELWVSRFGHYITEFNVRSNEDGTKASLVLNPIFNKDEVVEIPTDAIPFSEVQADIESALEDYSASYYDSYEDTEVTTTEFN